MQSLGAIQLHIQVTLETTAEGKKQAKLTRLAGPPAGDVARTMTVCSANRLEVQGTNPSVNFVQFANVYLYWVDGPPGEKLSTKTGKFLPQFIRGLMSIDPDLRAAILTKLEGSDWYFDGERIK